MIGGEMSPRDRELRLCGTTVVRLDPAHARQRGPAEAAAGVLLGHGGGRGPVGVEQQAGDVAARDRCHREQEQPAVAGAVELGTLSRPICPVAASSSASRGGTAALMWSRVRDRRRSRSDASRARRRSSP